MKMIIYFAVNNEGSNKSDYFPNPRELFPRRFKVLNDLNVAFLFEDTTVIVSIDSSVK